MTEATAITISRHKLAVVSADSLKSDGEHHLDINGNLNALIRRSNLGHVVYSWTEDLRNCEIDVSDIFFMTWYGRPFVPTQADIHGFLERFSNHLRRMKGN